MAQQTGRVTIKRNNNAFRSKPGATIDIGGEEREGMMTDQGVFLYKASNKMATVECTMPHMSDTDLKEIRDSKDVTVQFVTDTAVTYTVANAVLQTTPKIEDGEVKLTFIGSPAE